VQHFPIKVEKEEAPTAGTLIFFKLDLKRRRRRSSSNKLK
jgi:hypothetical protein